MFKAFGRRTVLLSFALMMFVTLFTGHTTFAQPAYDYDVIARTGAPVIDPDPTGGGNTGPLVDLGRGPSINDSNSVAFIARQANDLQGRMIMSDNKMLRVIYPVNSPTTIEDYAQINNQGQVVWRHDV